ncbi:MAG: alpha/beta hydrolase [Chitinophagaceae bacterium]|nr:alpha/beta hydrolase [Chitinophagaceae bacterium]
MKKLLLLLFLVDMLTCAFAQKSYYVDGSNNTKLHVQEFGNGNPVIILAGGPGLNAGYMEAVWKELSSKYRCIVLDQRGTGKSTLASVDSVTVNMENYVNDLEALRNYLKLDRLTLIGHSWGGMLSLHYAAMHPEKTEKLILLNSGGPTGKFFTYFGDNMNMRLHEEDRREIAMLDSMKKPSLRGIWPGYFFDRKRALATKPINDVELYGQPGISKYAIGSFVSTEKERISMLKNYKETVYLIQGRQDPVGESTVYEIRDLLPQLQIHFIEKCGHLPWLENNAQVKKFFDLLYEGLQ